MHDVFYNLSYIAMTTQYLTPIPQDNYQSVGLISAVVGFFLLAYFFMYHS